MFRNAKEGDKVYDIIKGDGIVTVNNSRSEYPIIVMFPRKLSMSYTYQGYRHESDIGPSLYSSKPIINVPEIRKCEKIKFLTMKTSYGRLQIKISLEMIDTEHQHFDHNTFIKFINIRTIDQGKTCEMISNDLYWDINHQYPNRDVGISIYDNNVGSEIFYKKD